VSELRASVSDGIAWHRDGTQIGFIAYQIDSTDSKHIKLQNDSLMTKALWQLFLPPFYFPQRELAHSRLRPNDLA